MKNSRLIIAVVVLIGLGVAVGLTSRSHQPQTKLEQPTTSLPKIKKDEISSIEIARPGKPLMVLAKEGDKWQMTAPLKAVASKVDIDQALDALADLQVVGTAAKSKDTHAKLEVDADKSTRVKAKAGDKPLVDLHIGASKTGGTMVRVEGEDTVFVAKGQIRYTFDKDVREFRNRDVTDFDAKEITAMALTSAKGTFKFERGEGDAWVQAKGEKPIAKYDPGKVSRLAEAFASLRAVDFAEPTDTDATTGLDAPMGKVSLTKKDGTTLQLVVGKQHKDGTEHFAKLVGEDVVYRITNYSSERMMPDTKAFEKSEAPAAPPGGMQPGGGVPGLEGMPPMAGMENLPPELIQKLKDMQAKGQMPPGHGQ